MHRYLTSMNRYLHWLICSDNQNLMPVRVHMHHQTNNHDFLLTVVRNEGKQQNIMIRDNV